MAVGHVLLRAARHVPEASLFAAILFLLFATAERALAPTTQIATIRIVTGQVPPEMDETGRGREAEIIRAALRQVYGDRKIEFHVVPFTRHWEAFSRDGRYDAVTTVPPRLDLGAFPSEVYVEYQNGIIYRRSDFPHGLGPRPVQMLHGKRLVAFAGAAGILPDVQQNVSAFQSYAEYDDQYVHSVMLARNFVDAVIADRLIVDQYNRQVLGRDYQRVSRQLAFDPAFCPTPYRMIFRTDEMRNAFNQGLSVIRRTGELARIDARYRGRSAIGEDNRNRSGCG